ncbi:hypothetical protein [Pontixanthobacter gangjinensis]|uniref:Phytoene synthase n=1 Tax=Pontixanthobacter gangjinensis TaxID=1028742 RepID=A0A6I4SMQ0_9SPHN|nr:hypothetical protein [Pontixanthobacter gangjinensis]MXO56954.1 hypothetical protein [Pontixanthobacter gangjinensis]
MEYSSNTTYPTPQEFALAHAGTDVRPRLNAFLALDGRLAQFVGQSKEPMLTQMRIAWWRDQLRKPVADRPKGDPILDDLSSSWSGENIALIALIDGWEALLAEPPLPETAALDFANGRAACFAALAKLCGKQASAGRAFLHGQYWALADLAVRVSEEDERRVIVSQCNALEPKLQPLPHSLRALSILGKLGERSLSKSGRSLVQSRSDILLVMRLGLFGR